MYGYISSPPIEIFHTPIFHTPPLVSISRLLSSRAFRSIDSSPWRLSCSCEPIQTHGRLSGMTASGKFPILSHHSIFMTQRPHTSTKACLYFFSFFPRPTWMGAMDANQNILWSKRKESNASLWSHLLCYSVMVPRERKKTKRRSETGTERWRKKVARDDATR